MFLFAGNTSPLVGRIGEDSGMYLLMGKAMASGKTLYLDLFDHKGPFIFMLNSLPQLFCQGTVGVWIVEVFFMFFSLIILQKAANKMTDSHFVFLIPLFYVWLTVSLFNGGNYTEEYCNLFSIIALGIYVFWQQEKNLTNGKAFVLGLCLAIPFFFRPNNIALPAAVILFIGIHTLRYQKENALRYILWALFGILTVTLPILIYHAINHSLYDMMYATVLHNLSYCQTGFSAFKFFPAAGGYATFCLLTIFALNIIAICTCFSNEDKINGLFLLTAFAVTFVSVVIGGRAFLYYWTLFVPQTAFAILIIVKHRNQSTAKKAEKAWLPVLAVCCVAAITVSFITYRPLEKKENAALYKKEAHALYNLIPTKEKNSFYAMDIPAVWLYETGAKTPLKYFTMQTWMSKTNPAITTVIASYLNTAKPKWLVTYYKNESSNPTIQKIIEKNYQYVSENKSGYLYKRVEQ